MAGLDTQWKTLVKQLKKLEVDTRKARGDARARLKKLDKQTRKMLERTLRQAEPHVRPAHVITPSALARHVLALGTTTLFADTLQFWELGGVRAFTEVADALARSPVKFYWMIRPHAQSRTTDEARRFPLRDLARALAHPSAVAAGEVTRWPEVHAGDPGLLARLAPAVARGQRVEGQTACASVERLAAIAAGGLSSDHEPITAREVLDRARPGLAVLLRESSLRPDLSDLLDALKEAPGLAARAMLTADGSMP